MNKTQSNKAQSRDIKIKRIISEDIGTDKKSIEWISIKETVTDEEKKYINKLLEELGGDQNENT